MRVARNCCFAKIAPRDRVPLRTIMALLACAALAVLGSASELSAFRQGRFTAVRAELAAAAVSVERARFLESELMQSATATARLTSQLESLRAEQAEQAELLEVGDARATVLQKTIADARVRMSAVKAQCAALDSGLEAANGRCEQLGGELEASRAAGLEKDAAIARMAQEVEELSALKSQLMQQLSQADTASHELAQTLRAEMAAAAGAHAAELERAKEGAAPLAAMVQTLKGQCSTLASELELAQQQTEDVRAELAKKARGAAAAPRKGFGFGKKK